MKKGGFTVWSGRRDSNPRPTAWKAVTLPLSYSRLGSGGLRASLNDNGDVALDAGLKRRAGDG